MKVGNEGMRPVTDAHQKALQGVEVDKRLTVLHLIRGSEGCNTPEGYTREVGTAGKEASFVVNTWCCGWMSMP